MWFSSGLLAAYYGPDWPGITALLAGENGYMQYTLEIFPALDYNSFRCYFSCYRNCTKNGERFQVLSLGSALLFGDFLHSPFPKSFTQDTAEKLNISPRTVEREIKVARDLTPATKEILKSSEKEVTQKNALKLSRLKPQQQEEAAKLLTEEKIRSVDEYSPAHRGTAIEKTQDNPPPKPRQTVSTVAPEKETKTDEATKPPAKKQPTTLSEIVADLKNHDKDASATPEAFIASFVSFASRMEGEIAWYGQEYYRPVFSRLSPEQMTQLHEVVLRIGAAAESIYSQVREFRKKGSANEL